MNILTTIISIATSVVSAILVFILQSAIKENNRLKREQEATKTARERALEEGVVCILRKHLMDEHELWTGRGYITPKALESGLLMYKAYKTLGGNGMIDHMEDEIQNLPIHD